MIQFFVEGPPVGKARPRHGRQGRVYTPAKTKAYEDLIFLRANLAARGKIFEGPIKVSLTVWHAAPKKPRKGHPCLEGERAPAMGGGPRADLDNVIKSILDGCSGIWHDDRQVVEIKALSFFCPEPGVAVTVEEFRHDSYLHGGPDRPDS